ncbi:hypothetical protein [Crenobacter caeni]|uniref:DUF1707 domain-containing protein n=1 Tax=Crenobacter caeni TaxID=2705474 RepID=A0A6B2KMH5_9NEIS|nr:hypothetical protein [Crenobacter caeni]NDV11341.1 hypothetical protein [Crenobacter caeni]
MPIRFLLIALLCLAGNGSAFADDDCDKQASHRLRELRVREALANGNLTHAEAERQLRRLHKETRRPSGHEQRRLAPDDAFDDDARHYWRDKRRYKAQPD